MWTLAQRLAACQCMPAQCTEQYLESKAELQQRTAKHERSMDTEPCSNRCDDANDLLIIAEVNLGFDRLRMKSAQSRFDELSAQVV